MTEKVILGRLLCAQFVQTQSMKAIAIVQTGRIELNKEKNEISIFLYYSHKSFVHIQIQYFPVLTHIHTLSKAYVWVCTVFIVSKTICEKETEVKLIARALSCTVKSSTYESTHSLWKHRATNTNLNHHFFANWRLIFFKLIYVPLYFRFILYRHSTLTKK